ncbi:hypothetical protein ACS0TY_003447 [Phlomoides rotata]
MCGTLSVIGNEMSQFVDTRIDWKETSEGHVFKVDVPGLKKEEVKVEVEEGNILQISGERTSEKDEKNYTWHRMEGSSTKERVYPIRPLMAGCPLALLVLLPRSGLVDILIKPPILEQLPELSEEVAALTGVVS